MNVPGWIAYVGTGDGEVHLVTSDGNLDVALTKNSGPNGVVWEKLVWSHDGNWVAGVAQTNNSSSHAIYILDLTQRNETQLNFVAEGFSPAWSPDDHSIAYLSGPLKAKGNLLAGKPSAVDLKKRQAQPPVTLFDEYQTLGPQWFQEGTRLLVGENKIISIDGSLLLAFDLPNQNNCVAASLSPFGNKLAVMETGGIVLYDLTRSNFDKNKPLSHLKADLSGKAGLTCGADRLNWSPNARYLYLYLNNGSDANLLINTAGIGTITLAGVYEPSFTVDGGTLVDFNPNIKGQIYAVPFGNRPVNPHFIAQSKIPPVWQPR